MREWLTTNGLGGYASGTVSGPATRRYHGLLIAALPEPFGRTVMLSRLAERVRFAGGRELDLGDYLDEFRLENGLPIWRYTVEGALIEKRVFMPYRQNTVLVLFDLRSGDHQIELTLTAAIHFRAQEAAVDEPLGGPYEITSAEQGFLGFEVSLKGSPLPPLRLRVHGEAAFVLDVKTIENVLYPVEESRGYPARGQVWSPGRFSVKLSSTTGATVIGSIESPETIAALPPAELLELELHRRRRLLAIAVAEARTEVGAELVLAADQFIVTPAGRSEEKARAHASGDDVKTVIAGYHWFTDWGRDTMIGLEGLTLVTGRHAEAAFILRTFGHFVRGGLIPNLFPEGRKEGLYHTADATLWFFHAIDRYVHWSNERLTLTFLYPTLKRIVDCHIGGTDFGIHVDPNDGLLSQGAPGYQLTWMDAKVDGWVVTPRHGKAVEINALWYNALRLMEQWAIEEGDEAGRREYADRTKQVFDSFNRRFWYAAGGHLYDVIDGEEGDDPKCRPNQIFAISLPHPVLVRDRWESVLHTIRSRLLTPFGLRSLAPDDPDFKPRYFGDLKARDAAYHQGTVWPWLAGPFVDAWLRVYPDDDAGARVALDDFVRHLDDACIGSISEIFDGDLPFTPRGCIAQGWSVAEVLRAWVKLARRARHPWAAASPKQVPSYNRGLEGGVR